MEKLDYRAMLQLRSEEALKFLGGEHKALSHIEARNRHNLTKWHIKKARTIANEMRQPAPPVQRLRDRLKGLLTFG